MEAHQNNVQDNAKLKKKVISAENLGKGIQSSKFRPNKTNTTLYGATSK
jgi:hypothetical protein